MAGLAPQCALVEALYQNYILSSGELYALADSEIENMSVAWTGVKNCTPVEHNQFLHGADCLNIFQLRGFVAEL